jgi:glyoxylase-like metal-dependent hydrolase (beta-lactamase superfamily II)
VKTRLLTVAVLLALTVQGVDAQDARNVLQEVGKNIGADTLRSLRIAGSTGYSSAPGATYSPYDDWPRFEITSYSKQIDFNAHFSREQITRQWGPYAAVGGGQGVPDHGQQKMDFVLNGNTAWLQSGGGAGPYDREGYMDGIPVAEMFQLDMIMTPQGFVKAALALGDNPSIVTIGPREHRVSYVSIVAIGKYHVTAAINESNEIESVMTHVANPMFGDMLYQYIYGPYKQFGSVKYPTTIHRDEGDSRLNPAHNAMQIQVSTVEVNVPVQVLPPPDSSKNPPENMENIETKKLADGVWYIGGIRHGSVAVQFRDFVVVVEAPLNERRAIAVIHEVHRLVPDKPIRYLVNTHHHFDHSGGVRTYAAEGATIVTSYLNQDFFEKVVFSSAARTIEPDRLSLLTPDQWPHPLLGLVHDRYIISDGTQEIDVYPLPAFNHVENMTVAYLPRQKMVINGDVYAPPAEGGPLPTKAGPGQRILLETIQRLGLDVTTHVGLHGGFGSEDDLVKIVGQSAAAN